MNLVFDLFSSIIKIYSNWCLFFFFSIDTRWYRRKDIQLNSIRPATKTNELLYRIELFLFSSCSLSLSFWLMLTESQSHLFLSSLSSAKPSECSRRKSTVSFVSLFETFTYRSELFEREEKLINFVSIVLNWFYIQKSLTVDNPICERIDFYLPVVLIEIDSRFSSSLIVVTYFSLFFSFKFLMIA